MHGGMLRPSELEREWKRDKERYKGLPILELVDIGHHLLRAIPGMILILLFDENQHSFRHLTGDETIPRLEA